MRLFAATILVFGVACSGDGALTTVDDGAPASDAVIVLDFGYLEPGSQDPGPPADQCAGSGDCVCVPDCVGRICGSDGCGGSCGECDGNRVCDNDGLCVFMPLVDLGDGTLLDPGSGLVWQEIWVGQWPQPDAIAYCDANQAGLVGTGWRLPTLDELRTLVRECGKTVTDGSCVVGEGCLSEEDCWHGKCAGCDADLGPDDGCYRDSLLVGECVAYWSSSVDTTDPDHAWYLDFATAAVLAGAKANARGLRCVRNGP